MLRTHAALIPLIAASAFVTACGAKSDSDGDATGGVVTGGRSSTGDLAGSTSSIGGAAEAGGTPSGAGSSAGGSGAESSGGASAGGRAPTGGVSSGGDGAATAGGAQAGGTGGATGGVRASGGRATGGSPTAGTAAGGNPEGGSGNAPAGGASAGTFAGGALSGGAMPTGGTGGTGGSERVVCGAIFCDEHEFCCGPSQCGVCVSDFVGGVCADVCPGFGGAGGTAADCGTNDYALPRLDRACTTDSDCFVGAHWTDCCGSQMAVAFNRGDSARFNAYEAACQPNCECEGEPPVTQEGTPLSRIIDAVAECVGGLCLARAPQNVGTCLADDVCISVEQEGSCIPATGPVGSGTCRGGDGICAFCICAAPDTPIATPSGDRPIAELRVGDPVYSVDDDAIVVVPIAEVQRTRVVAHHVIEVRLESGPVLQVSAGHPTADGRTFADLVGGGQLDGQRILEAHTIAYPHQYTHDILPASSTGTYFAGGALIGSTLF